MKFGRRTLLKFASLAVVSAHPKAFASEPTSALYDVIIVGGAEQDYRQLLTWRQAENGSFFSKKQKK